MVLAAANNKEIRVTQINVVTTTPIPATEKETRAYRPDIDGLRAIAVLSVLFFHAEIMGFSGGFVGVDIFFVISGYLITKNIVSDIQQQRWSFKTFYIRRWRRLFPAAFFVLLLCFLFAFLLFSPPQMSRFGQSLLYALTYLSNFFFWFESGYCDFFSKLKPLLHMWSLAVEEQFYLIWPLTIVILMSVRLRYFVPSALIVISGISLVFGEMLLDSEPSAVFYLSPFRMFEFSIGAILVWLKPLKSSQGLCHEVLLLTGFLLMFYTITQYNEFTPFPGVNALIPCLGAALAIYAGTAKYLGSFLRNRLAVGIGLISYSVYLIHWPLIVFYKYWSLKELTPEIQLTVVILSFGLGYLIYRFVEQPFRGSTRPSNHLSGWGYIATCLALVAIVAIPAFSAWQDNGWTWRVNYDESRGAMLEELSYPDVTCLPEKNLPGCFIGEDKIGPADILLIGDSHAEHLSTAFDYLGEKYHVKVHKWRLLGCPPIFNTKKIYAERFREYEDKCETVIAQWEHYISRTKPEVVVLAARWGHNIEPLPDSETVDRRHLLLDNDNPIVSLEAARKVFTSRLKETANTITQTGSKVIIVSQVPMNETDPSTCNNKPDYLFFSRENFWDRCQRPSYEKMRSHLLLADNTIRDIEKSNSDVLAIFMSDIFCSDATRHCKFTEADVLLYKDGNHLNEYGSLYVAKSIEERLMGFIRGI